MKTTLDGYLYELELEFGEEYCFILAGQRHRIEDKENLRGPWEELDNEQLDALQDKLAAELEGEHLNRRIMQAEAYYEGDR